MKLGEHIATLRYEKALTQRELAEMASVSPSTLCQIERGRVPRPHPGTMRNIAEALGVEPAELRKASPEEHRDRLDTEAADQVMADDSDEIIPFERTLHTANSRAHEVARAVLEWLAAWREAGEITGSANYGFIQRNAPEEALRRTEEAARGTARAALAYEEAVRDMQDELKAEDEGWAGGSI